MDIITETTEEDIQTIGGLIFVAKIIAEEQRAHPKKQGQVTLPADEVMDIATIFIKFMELTFTLEQKTQVANYARDMETMQEVHAARESNQLQ